MIKLGFHIVTNSKALWVQVFRTKYKMSSGLPETISHKRYSFLWKSLANTWLLFKENLLWSVGDERKSDVGATHGFQMWGLWLN